LSLAESTDELVLNYENSNTTEIVFSDSITIDNYPAVVWDVEAQQLLYRQEGRWVPIHELDIPICREGQYLTYLDNELKCTTPKETQMTWTFSTIFIVALISVIASKWITPKISWKEGIKWFVRLIYNPFKKTEKEIETAWNENTEKKEE
jgi:hypothetical protein